jgi:hypothetical protein
MDHAAAGWTSKRTIGIRGHRHPEEHRATASPAATCGWSPKTMDRVIGPYGKIRHGKPGRPLVPKKVRQLIRMLSRENPLWGAPLSVVKIRPIEKSAVTAF